MSEKHLDHGRPLHRRPAPGGRRSDVRGGAQGQCGRRAAGHRRVADRRASSCNLLVRIPGARRILEIGTLGGYSTIWMAKALPAGGRLVSLEYAEKHADVARENVARAGLLEMVDVRVGAALDLAAALVERRRST